MTGMEYSDDESFPDYDSDNAIPRDDAAIQDSFRNIKIYEIPTGIDTSGITDPAQMKIIKDATVTRTVYDEEGNPQPEKFLTMPMLVALEGAQSFPTDEKIVFPQQQSK